MGFGTKNSKGFAVCTALLATLVAAPAAADELSEARARVMTYELLRGAGVNDLPAGFPASMVLQMRMMEADNRVAAFERAPAADVKKWLQETLKGYEGFDASKYPPGIRVEMDRVVRDTRYHLASGAALPDEDAKKAWVAYQKKVNADLKKEIVAMQLREELPVASAATDRLFDGMGDKVKDTWLDLGLLENAAINANGTITQAKSIIAAIDGKQLSEDDLYRIVRGARTPIPLGPGSTYAEKVKSGLEGVIKKNEDRISTLRATYVARQRAIRSLPETPKLVPAGPPTRNGPRYTSVNAMAAGEGAGFMRGPLNGAGRLTGAPNLGTVVDFGMRAGAFYENSALTTFQLHESWRRQREYEDRVRDWEKNGRKDWERYQREEWQRENDARMRDFRLRQLLGLPLVGAIGRAPNTEGGINVGRFANTNAVASGDGAGASGTTSIEAAGLNRDARL